jgi:hypothetical protein
MTGRISATSFINVVPGTVHTHPRTAAAPYLALRSTEDIGKS